jgi:hypothetical protein
MQTLTVQLKIAAPMEEALRLAAWEDETSIGTIVRNAISRDMRRRKALGQVQVAQIAGREEEVMRVS